MEAHEMIEAAWRAEEERENGLFQAGARSERIRLRPLLERCLADLERRNPILFEDIEPFKALLADLRRELVKGGDAT